ncbi:MAG: Glycine-tRNA ligase [Candidatus Nomurabacteria bacterium GW2011_GWF2_35_12]|uniref:Glycine-tRNA ligase n=3 Tax=Candidatus Nomuraibacteriota TaxID=1752729 RepID=A0A0G0GCB6_9BACT|nr:MAG: Glycine-tRNA ligase [Candidatus Nomurabacteria bacterium GW2011_GWF2_35_12]KKP72906.1 MAG: Glycine-tRNA ligase [Candidatus Nomurabacteria bacterium GW2011_GWB1_35_20]KKP74677.1 MAG: Glycine-tRNA ligase [Parcubacteria group bacterium GW2011_GWC1_35_21]KKP77724.1 MAG: Glycine-tRNA ligase [Candidatus Nomurabacteria bacterium GW2011_GWC2_35_35]KKP84538.1 MAG: Glycine-tRNA ligase [Parcubacteria group bacterium GW2011_GWD2_35_7]KKP88233.1 MAG: Glycine-tRNA ligase [Candidatus Nomurabacteria b
MKENATKNNLMEKIVSLCKRRGFVFAGSEIYGGLAGTYDWGHFGLALKNNIKQSWWKKFVDNRRDMYGIDTAILMNSKVWEAAGHVTNFADSLDGKKFNTMLKTQVGAKKEEVAVSYLRPETAQGMFVNFKNTVDAFHPKLPFGMAQIGKAFRNEIAPRDFLFRQREFEQMEIEYFTREEDWEKYFEYWKGEMLEWMEEIGIDMGKIHELEVSDEDRAHYSKRTVDFEFDYPFGRKELFGLAYRTDFDLKNHKLDYIDEESAEKIIPHVIEPTFGVDRAMLVLLLSAYCEDEKGGEIRAHLKFKPSIAPVICAVSPLLKNKPELVEYANTKVFAPLKAEFGRVIWDDNGNIGKRYRRQDEIGTPFCIVIDFDTLTDNTVTVRDRDTGEQERIKVENLKSYIKEKI